MRLKIEIVSKDTEGMLRLLEKVRAEIVYQNALKNNINFTEKDIDGGVSVVCNEPIKQFDWE